MTKDYKYKVTIGMPVYGVEPYIRKCMLSVLNQTFKDSIPTKSSLFWIDWRIIVQYDAGLNMKFNHQSDSQQNNKGEKDKYNA